MPLEFVFLTTIQYLFLFVIDYIEVMVSLLLQDELKTHRMPFCICLSCSISFRLSVGSKSYPNSRLYICYMRHSLASLWRPIPLLTLLPCHCVFSLFFPCSIFSDSVKIPPPQANTPVSDSPCLPFVSCILHCCHRMYHLSEIAQTLSLCCTLESYLRIRTTCFVCVTWNLKKVTTFLRNKLNIWG